MAILEKLLGRVGREEADLLRNNKYAREEEDKDSLVSFVEKEYKRRQDERHPFEIQWRLNISFIEGNQFVDVNPVSMNLEDVPKLYDWQEREAYNHIAPIVEIRTAKLSRIRPMLKTRPGTSAQEDIRAAKVGTSILKNTYYEQGIQNKMSEVYAWLDSCGSVLMKNAWNPEKGPIAAYEGAIPMLEGTDGVFQLMGGESTPASPFVEEEGEETPAVVEGEIMQEETQVSLGEEGLPIREGDLDPIICPPFEIFPDSSYRQNIENCRSIIHAKSFHVEEIEDMWGVQVPSEDTNAMKLNKTNISHSSLGFGLHGGFRFTTTALKDHAVVKEYWEKPSKKHPKGRLIIVAGGKLLHKGPLPYPVGDDGEVALPFVKCDCIERPGVFWGKSLVERLIPLQRRYNALKNRKAEFLNRIAIGSWWAQEGSVDIDEVSENIGAPGYIGVYKQGSTPPVPMQNGNWPPEADREEANILADFNALSGVSDLSKTSQAPPGVKSGVALNIAAEQDDTRLSATAQNVEQFLIENAKQWLRLYKHYVASPRTLREIGENNIIEAIDWVGADIKSDDVIVEAFSAMVESPAMRRQMVFDILGTGLLVDPDTGRINKEMRSKILEMIELGNWESSDSDDQLHTAKAERENLAIINGDLPQAVSYDDHIMHIDRHNKFRLTTDYEEMLQQAPWLEELFRQHVNMHLMFMMPMQMQGPPAGVGAPMEGGEGIPIEGDIMPPEGAV